MANILLRGSERVAMTGARVLAPADPTERLEVTVLVRRRARGELQARVAQLAAGKDGAPYLTREEFAARHGFSLTLAIDPSARKEKFCLKDWSEF